MPLDANRRLRLIFNTAPLRWTRLSPAAHLEEGRLIRVLEEWCPPFAGYHLYYPSRRWPSPAFTLVVNALRVGSASFAR